MDNGNSWVHAPVRPGVLLPEGITPMFKYVVTNTGNVALTGATVTDSVLGEIATGVDIGVGDSQSWTKG